MVQGVPPPGAPAEQEVPPASRRARRLDRTQQAKPSRAGRNLPAAIAVGLSLLGLIVLSLTIWKPGFVVLVSIIAVIGVWELSAAVRQSRVHPPLPPLVASAVLPALAYWGGPDALAVGFATAAALVLVWRAVGPPTGAVRDVAGGVFIVAYVPLLAAITSLMLAEDDGIWRILTFILVTVASDTGGYAVGVFLGRTPMAPSLSPKKSWEGFAGSVGTSALTGVLCVTLLLSGPWWAGAIIGALAAVFATVGDLVESSIKRDLGIKDMGDLLPGHGGIMDRLDSLLVTAPICWALLYVLV